MNALDRYADTEAARARQSKDDAYQEEIRARARKKASDEDSALEKLRGDTSSLLDESNGPQVDARTLLKLNPATQQVINQGAPEFTGNRSERDARPTPTEESIAAATPAKPVAQPEVQAPQNTAMDRSINMAKANFSYARSIGDIKGLQSAADMYNKLKLEKSTAEVAHFVQNASDEELQQISSQITENGTNLYKSAYDPVTKFTTIQLGDAKATLSKAQLGQFAAAKYRLSQGDTTALQDMSNISESLTKKVAESLGVADKLSSSTNTATNNRATLDRQDEQLKISKAQLGLRQSSAAKSNDPLHALKAATSVFKSVYKREPTQDEMAKLAGLAKDGYEKSDAEFANDIVKAGVAAGTIDVANAPSARQQVIDQSKAQRKPAIATTPGMQMLLSGLSAAKSDGQLGSAIKELQDKGLSDAQIQSLVAQLK